MRYHAIPCNTMQYNAIPCNTKQHHSIPCIINNCWRSVPLTCGQYNGHFLRHASGSMFSTDICVLKTSSLRRASLKGLSCRNFSADSQLISFRRTAFHHFFKKLPSHVRNSKKGNDFRQNPIGPVWPSRLILSGRGSLFSRLIHSPPSLCLVKEQHKDFFTEFITFCFCVHP